MLGNIVFYAIVLGGLYLIFQKFQSKNAAAPGGRRAVQKLPAKHRQARVLDGELPKVRVLIRDGYEDCSVDSDPFTIGRRPDNKLILDHQNVSRLHAELRREDGRWCLFDVGSANGVYVNGRRISGETLTHDDNIKIGPFTLQFVHPTPAPPQIFDVKDLTLEKEIGHGGMARVYLARVNADGSRVAVKMPSFSRCKDPGQRAELRRRFLREVEISEALRHPNIVRVLGHGTTPDQVPYMVMEFVQGGTMRSVLQAGKPMVEEQIRSIGLELAAGLALAHDRSVIHRDIKPENVLLDEQGCSKLSDFGIARAQDLPSLTVPGMVMGTCHYMSPEQARGEATITAASDLYSLGCMLFEMSVGRCPFEGEGMAILRSHVNDTPVRARSLNPALSPEFDLMLSRMLEKIPTRRPNVEEIQSLLAQS